MVPFDPEASGIVFRQERQAVRPAGVARCLAGMRLSAIAWYAFAEVRTGRRDSVGPNQPEQLLINQLADGLHVQV